MAKFEELKNILKIAIPSSIASLGHLVYSLIDNIMVGRFLGVGHLASSGIASSFYHIFLPFGAGSLSFIAGRMSYYLAQSNIIEARNIFKEGLIFSFLAGVIICVILLLISPLTGLFGETGEIGINAYSYLSILCFSSIFAIPFLAFEKSTEGLGDTRIVIFIMIFTNLLNAFLNYSLILGEFGMPAVGLNGASIATLVSTIFELIIIIFLFPFFKKLKIMFERFTDFKFKLKSFIKLVKFAVPSGLQVFFENSMFAICMLIASIASMHDGAAYQISMMVTTFPFIFIYGFLGAITVRVANYFALRNKGMIISIIKYSIISVVILMITISLIYIFYSNEIAGLFLKNEEQNVKAIQILVFAFLFIGVIEIFDALQITLSSVLRGMGDSKVPSIISFISFWCVAIPLSYIAGVIFDFGMPGVWVGIGVGIIASFLSLSFRLKFLMNKFFL